MILQVYLEAAFLEAKLVVQRAHPLDKVTPERARPIPLTPAALRAPPSLYPGAAGGRTRTFAHPAGANGASLLIFSFQS